VRAKNPGPELQDVRFVNDWIVSRTGWDENASVVALRSGGPGNHEHADRNSVIFAAFGERLLHDPFKAAYSYTLPHWVLRQTEAHTAVLIGGKGHQYHDGHEGTNSSWSEARILQYKPSAGHLVVTSDATEAYALVNPDVDLVRRTVVFVKPDVVLLYDRVRLKSSKSRVQLRFQIYNGDGQGGSKIGTEDFLILRPLATLRASVFASGPFVIRSGAHPVPQDVGVYPYIEVEASDALEHQIITVCTAQSAGKDHGKVSHSTAGSVWILTVDHNGKKKKMAVDVAEELPTVAVE
jgi:hypothetical protein